MNRQRGHCHVWWRHSIGALQRRQRSTVGSGFLRHVRMFTARAATRRMVIAETDDSISISSFARRVSGIASVGLNAIEFVNET